MSFDKADSAITAFTLGAFGVFLLMCLWKTRRRTKGYTKELPMRVKVVDDHYSIPKEKPKKARQPVKEEPLLPPASTEPIGVSAAPPAVSKEYEDVGEAVTQHAIDVQSAVPRIVEEETALVEEATVLDRVKAKARLITLARRFKLKQAVKGWKKQEAERRKLLKGGKVGSMHLNIGEKMNVTNVREGGASAAAGVQIGDVVVEIRREGRGGNTVRVPMPKRTSFLRAAGPQSEVYEGSKIHMVVIRNPKEQDAWYDDADETSSLRIGTPPFVDAWIKRVERREHIAIEITVGPETEKARETRRRNMEKKKKENKLDKLDVNLVDDFLSDPDKCAVFVKGIFEKADKDGSGQLEIDEIHDVFTQLTEFSGVPAPSKKDTEALFHTMDESNDRSVSFEEFFPYFRTCMIRLIMESLVATHEDS